MADPSPLAAPEAKRRLCLAFLVASFYALLIWHPEWMARLGVTHGGIWFLDTHAVLASSDARAMGLNPYAPNPLDFLHQRHVYSDWWFGLHALGLTRDDYLRVGALIGFVFLATAILSLRPRSSGELLWSAALLTAPPMVLGFNRGNADLLLFIVLAIAAEGLASTHRFARWLGMVGILFATGLKFFPVFASLALLVPVRRRREAWGEIAVFGTMLAFVGWQVWPGIQRYLADSYQPAGFFTFGIGAADGLFSTTPQLGHTALLVITFATSAWWWHACPSWPESSDRDQTRFAVGATITIGCYFASVNYGYRLVFAVLTAPFLWRAWSLSNGPRPLLVLGRSATVLLVLVLWLDGLVRLAASFAGWIPRPDAVWLATLARIEQPISAALVITLLGLLIPLLRAGGDALLNTQRNSAVVTH